jgi:O-antigen ligase
MWNCFAPTRNVNQPAQAGSGILPGSFSGFVPRFLCRQPTFTAAFLFLLILSGPPKLRARDAEASLRGDADWVVILHVLVWGLAGIWVLLQIGKRLYAKQPLLRLRLAQILGLAMILCLAASAVISKAPALSAFKIYQMLVSLLFVQIYAQRFGLRNCLKGMFLGYTLLCIAIAVCAVVAPDVVWAHSDFDFERSRLRGDLIASTGVVSAFAIILLLTNVRKIWRVLPLSLFALFLGLLALSLMRTAYLVVILYFALVFLKRPSQRPLRRFTLIFCLLGLTLYAGGWLPRLNNYRDPETISTLSERTGLWSHLVEVTMARSPWFGLGYYSASRIYGPEYNPGFGTAHSMFLEVFLGGGLLSFALLVALCLTLSVYAIRLLWLGKDRLCFVTLSLFIATILLCFIGEEIDSGPAATSFWYTATALPLLYERVLKRTPPAQSTQVHAIV